jgi:hypothetical protein
MKTGGAAGLTAGGLLILSVLVHATTSVEGPLDTGAEYLLSSIVLLAYLAVIVAILGVHATHRGQSRFRRVATVGAAAAGTGYAVIAAVTAISMVRDAEELLAVRIAGAGLVLVGSTVLGVAVLVTRVLLWWCGALLITAFPLRSRHRPANARLVRPAATRVP